MAETTHERRKKTIIDLATGNQQPFDSVNAAKRKSREIQLANGGLGKGSVRVKGDS